jgi:hypothetical protein
MRPATLFSCSSRSDTVGAGLRPFSNPSASAAMVASSGLLFIIAVSLPKWPRGVVLTPVRVDTVDPAFDVVLADAAIAVVAQQEALAGIDHEEPARAKLRRPARVREATPALLT